MYSILNIHVCLRIYPPRFFSKSRSSRIFACFARRLETRSRPALTNAIVHTPSRSHLDPLVEEDVHALASLYTLGLISDTDYQDLYIRRHGNWPWDWLPAWPAHMSATFGGTGYSFDIWLEKLFDQACRTGQNNLIDMLVVRGIQPAQDHLISAASGGMNDTVDHLVNRYHLDPNGTTSTGSWSPLYAACMHGQECTIRHLISTYHVDYHSRTGTGENIAFHLSSRWPRCQAVLSSYLDQAR